MKRGKGGTEIPFSSSSSSPECRPQGESTRDKPLPRKTTGANSTSRAGRLESGAVLLRTCLVSCATSRAPLVGFLPRVCEKVLATHVRSGHPEPSSRPGEKQRARIRERPGFAGALFKRIVSLSFSAASERCARKPARGGAPGGIARGTTPTYPRESEVRAPVIFSTKKNAMELPIVCPSKARRVGSKCCLVALWPISRT